MNHQSTRYDAVDAVRGIAAVFVMTFHFLLHYGREYNLTFSDFSSPIWVEALRYGPHIFFIISGFVIFKTIDRSSSFRTFFKARLIRILPAFWFAIPFSAAITHIAGPERLQASFLALGINALFLPEVLGFDLSDPVYWSLLVEMAFYLFIGGILFLSRGHLSVRWVLWGWLALSFFSLLFYPSLPSSIELIIKEALIVRYSVFFVSGMVFYLFVKEGFLRKSDKGLLVGCALVMMLSVKSAFGEMLVLATLLFPFVVRGSFDWLLCRRPLIWLGHISYPLYLTHYVLGFAIINTMIAQDLPDLLSVSVAFVASILVASSVHYCVEKPAWRFFRR